MLPVLNRLFLETHSHCRMTVNALAEILIPLTIDRLSRKTRLNRTMCPDGMPLLLVPEHPHDEARLHSGRVEQLRDGPDGVPLMSDHDVADGIPIPLMPDLLLDETRLHHGRVA